VWQQNEKHGLRSGPNSPNETEQLGSDRTPDKKHNQEPETGNVEDMPEGGGNTYPQKVRICATITSQTVARKPVRARLLCATLSLVLPVTFGDYCMP